MDRDSRMNCQELINHRLGHYIAIGDVAHCRRLIEEYGADVNTPNCVRYVDRSFRPLELAIEEGDLRIVDLLLLLGADPELGCPCPLDRAKSVLEESPPQSEQKSIYDSIERAARERAPDPPLTNEERNAILSLLKTPPPYTV